jgi:hypothetical protein
MAFAPRILKVWFGTVLFLASLAAPGQESGAENPYRVKAAFLRNFAHYVKWPDSVFADAAAPWRICILGRDPFGEVLDKTLQGRTEQARSFEILRAEAPEGLPPCQIVFVALRDPAKRRAALLALKDQPALTVGDAPDFLAEGGMIRFQVTDRVQIAVNLDRTRAASLGVPTKMLEVSSEVLENGNLKAMR